MTTLIADIETDGLLDDVTIIHSIVYEDFDTGIVTSCNDHGYKAPGAQRHLTIAEGLEELSAADKIVYHNGIKYDIPVQQKLHPKWHARGIVEDTLVMSRLVWSNIKEGDMGRVKRGTLPGKLMGSHGLEAWGYRLKKWKGDYAKEREKALKDKHERMGLPSPTSEEIRLHVWGNWNEEMQDYCVQDVAVTSDLYRRILDKNYSATALLLEHEAATLCAQIERNGFPLHEEKATVLYGTLSGKRAELELELTRVFGSWIEPSATANGVAVSTTPKVANKTAGIWGEKVLINADGEEITLPSFVDAHTTPNGALTATAKRMGMSLRFKGYPYTKIKYVDFNPASRHHIANRLKTLYGWKPQEFTPSGDPKIDETVLEGLNYPTAPLLNTYFLVQKRIGQLAEGKQAWLKVVKDGHIHGSINPNGAVTGRATHSFPNVAQVPKVKTKKFKKGEEPAGFILLEDHGDKVEGIVTGLDGGYGFECRSLFTVPKGWTQIGTDMSGLELRCLAHFMARWDEGEYGRIVLEEDIHTVNQLAAGLPTRDNAKTFIYAFLYGAGDGKLGAITGRQAKDGKRLRANFEAKIPAMGKLTQAVKAKAKQGFLGGLDQRKLHVRSEHSALNTLLQSAGALLCKKWMVLMDQRLRERGYHHGWTKSDGSQGDYAFLAWVHDEVQIAARTPELAEEIGVLSNECAREAGEFFNFRIKLEADFKVGADWAWCH
jgi:DNA polymerase I